MQSFLGFFTCAFLIVFGIIAIIKPKLVWKVDHYFTVKDGEPTDLYLAMSRIGGIALVAIGVACIFAL